MQQTAARFTFVTGHEFGKAVFETLLDSPEYGSGISCGLLLTLTPEKQGSTTGFTDIGPYAGDRGVPVESIRSIKGTRAFRLIEDSRPDYLLVIGWSELAPTRVLNVPQTRHRSATRHACDHGCIGMHPSLLPEGRGRAPIPWAILKGLITTGVTSFLLEEGADAGGIVGQERIPLEADTTATTLFARARSAHQALAVPLAAMMARRTLSWVPQDDARATIWPQRRPEDGEMDFFQSAMDLDRLVRALTPPYPGAFFCHEGQRVTVDSLTIMAGTARESPGTVLSTSDNDGILIATRDHPVLITSYRPWPVGFRVGDRIFRSLGATAD